MPRKGITLQDVTRACIALRKQGRAMTPTNIRLELGRGSYATISKHRRTLAFVETGQLAPRRRKQETETIPE